MVDILAWLLIIHNL